LNIALKCNGDAVPISDISRRESISVQYLEQLLNKLRHEGFVRSVRGPRGGYIMARGPEKITIRDIVKTLEGDISPIYCITSKKDLKALCARSKSCVTRIVWLKLAKAIDDCLESMTLEDLCAEAKKIKYHQARR